MVLRDASPKDPDEVQQYPGTHTVELDDDGAPVVVRPYGGPIVLSSEVEPWERQPVERDKDWILFKIYRDLPLDIRSIKAAYQQYAEATPSVHYNPDAYNYPPPWVRAITKAHKWKLRADAFDRYMDECDIHLMSRQRLEAIKAAAHLGKTMRDKALEALVRLRAVIYERVTHPDGTEEDILVSNLSPNAIVQLAKVGVELERAALGIEKTGGRPSVSVNVALGIQVNDADLVARATKVLEARKVNSITAPPEVVYAEVVETTAIDHPD